MEQLALIAIPAVPQLTDRQQTIHTALQAAGPDGLEASEAGALLHEDRGVHGRDQRCQWCPSTGTEVLKALRKKGLARYRRKLGAWTVAGKQPTAPVEARPGSVPYNEFPAGY